MKKLMTAAMFGLGMAAIAATADYQVYSFQQTGKAFDAAKDKVVTENISIPFAHCVRNGMNV